MHLLACSRAPSSRALPLAVRPSISESCSNDLMHESHPQRRMTRPGCVRHNTGMSITWQTQVKRMPQPWQLFTSRGASMVSSVLYSRCCMSSAHAMRITYAQE